MAEYGFYRDSGAAWQRALPPEVQRMNRINMKWQGESLP